MTSAREHWFSWLAAADSFTHMGQRFQRQYSDWQVSHILLFVILIVASVVCAWLLSRYIHQRRGDGNSPHALFAELCRAHRLGWSDRRLLAQLAKSQHLSSAAQLFVEPLHFEAECLDPTMRERQKELHGLRDKMFGAEWRQPNLGSK